MRAYFRSGPVLAFAVALLVPARLSAETAAPIPEPPIAEAADGAAPTAALDPTPMMAGVPTVAASVERSTVAIIEYRPRRRAAQDKYDITGSGFFVSAEGHVLTAEHVLKQAIGTTKPTPGSTKADIKRLAIGWMPDRHTTQATILSNRSGQAMRIVARDTERDLVLFKVNTDKAVPVRFIESDVPIGFEVGFMGFPFGNVLGFRPLLNRGSISGRRQLPGIGKKAPPFVGYILDGAVHPGHSGSPVFDIESGAVVAMIQRRLAETIPVTIASRELLRFLREAGVEPLIADATH